jgi:hypothetical protein
MGKKMKYCFLVRDTAYIATFPLSSTIQIKQKKMLKEQKQKQRKKRGRRNSSHHKTNG